MKKSIVLGVALVAVVMMAASCTKEPAATTPSASTPKPDEHVHVYGEWEIAAPATCSEKGAEKRECACGDYEEREVSATGEHNYTNWTVTTAPTCADKGVETGTCECGATDTREVDATGEHNYTNWTVTTAPTCADKGAETGTCECGATDTREVDATGEHNYINWTVTTEPTCVDKGVETGTCGCGATDTREVDATGEHNYTNWTVTTEPSCVDKGVETGTCGCGATDTREVDATGEHNYTNWTVTTEPTCVDKGVETGTCACGATDTREVDATGEHNYANWTVTTEPTCVDKGVETGTCGCGATDTREVDATGEHNYTNWNETKKPTCTNPGEEKGTCGCGATTTRPVSATGVHSYTARSEVTEPTCTANGYTTRYCACGASKTDTPTPATGHELDGVWVTVKQATVIQKEKQEQHCSNCSYVDTRYAGEYSTYVKASVLSKLVNIYGEYLESGRSNSKYDSSLDATFATPYGDKGVDFGQGGCYNGRYYYQAFVNVKDNGGVIAKLDTKTGEVVAYSEARNIGHANDITYNSKTNEIVVIIARTAEPLQLKTLVIFDADTLAYKREQSIPVNATGISYNPHNDTYVIYNGGGWYFYILDSNFRLISSSGMIQPPFRTETDTSKRCASQGICSDENYIYSLFYEDVDNIASTFDYKAYVQVRDYEFNLVTTFEIELKSGAHEAENISLVNGKFYVGAASLYYTGGKLRPYADVTVYEFNP